MVYRTDVPTAASAPPSVGTVGVEGFPTAGSPPSVPPTVIDPYFVYALCEEIRNVVVAAGETPQKALTNQLLTAIMALKLSYGGGSLNSMGSGTSISTSTSFTPARSGVILVNGNCAGQNITGAGLNVGGATQFANSQNWASGSSLGVYSGAWAVSAGVPVTITAVANFGTSTAATIGFNFVYIPTS